MSETAGPFRVGDAEAIITTALTAANPKPLKGDVPFYSVVVPQGASVETIDVQELLTPYLEHPRRKTGTFRVHDAASFVAYLGKHALHQTEVWADVPSARIVAVINAHLGTTGDGIEDYAGHADHRVTYDVQHTDAWKAWAAHDGKMLDQATFAEHIEDRSIDIVRPTSADMLELAQTFQATIGVSFESSKLLSSGQRQLEYKETVESRAGRKGQLEIPKDFQIAVVPFEGADPYKVTARFRYRITEGALRIGYRLDRPADVLREAFLGVVEQIAEGVDAPVLRGVSP